MLYYLRRDLPSGDGVALALCEDCPDIFFHLQRERHFVLLKKKMFYHSTTLLRAGYRNNLYPTAEYWWESAANVAYFRQPSALYPSLPRKNCCSLQRDDRSVSGWLCSRHPVTGKSPGTAGIRAAQVPQHSRDPHGAWGDSSALSRVAPKGSYTYKSAT